MTALAQNIVKVPGVALVQQFCSRVAKTLDKHTVPHWCDYLNKK